ncbi:unnamed protein product [Blepharisma stoltei]|uniref:Uncharacterized protein n=1 Tax=Blepharisma stoltei TaxID=1481888 RepID=A0AAU9KHQ1_9CILI|nr:unnamed protein product [Blepharisma stoltei]
MDVAGDLCNHLKTNLLYPGDISTQDLSQVLQGVAKPIFQFLMKHTKSSSDAKTIRANSMLNSVNNIRSSKQIDTSNSQKILSQISANQEVINKLKSEINLKRAKRSILQAYVYKNDRLREKIAKSKEILEALNNQKSSPENIKINEELLSQAADRLLYLSTTKAKPLDIPVNAIKGILDSLGIDLETTAVFSHLISENKFAFTELYSMINNFHPENEIRTIGVKLIKIGDHFQVENIDTSLLIDKLAAKIAKERESTWEAFNDCENMLHYTKNLRKNFISLFERKESYSSAKLKEFHKLEIELQSKKAQVNSLQNSMRELIQKKEDLSQKIILLQRQKQKGEKEGKTSLSLQVSAIVERNSSLRRDLGKYKLRIDEFMQNHILAIRNDIPELLKPLLTCISRECSEFAKIQNYLVPLNIPNHPSTSGPEATISSQLRTPITNRQLKRVFEACHTELYQSEKNLIENIKNALKHPSEIQLEVPEIIAIKDEDKTRRERLRLVELKLHDEEKELNNLEHNVLPIWKEQPTQHCIPWKRDAAGLNISEALELWKYKY